MVAHEIPDGSLGDFSPAAQRLILQFAKGQYASFQDIGATEMIRLLDDSDFLSAVYSTAGGGQNILDALRARITTTFEAVRDDLSKLRLRSREDVEDEQAIIRRAIDGKKAVSPPVDDNPY